MKRVLHPVESSSYIIHYRHGRVCEITPKPAGPCYDNRDLIYNAVTICSDGVTYTLSDKETIHSIAVPKYSLYIPNRHSEALGVTGYLDYALRMKASDYKGQGNDELAIACLEKATQLMVYSPIGWMPKDYYRIVYWLEELGNFGYAEKWERWITRHVPSEASQTAERFKQTLRDMKEFKTDLVYISWNGAESAVVAKYQGRVYSVSGADKRFPVLPEFIRKQGCVLPPYGGCVGGPYTYFGDKHLDTIYYKGKNIPVRKASWRPWCDDRSPEEKNAYLKRIESIRNKELASKNTRIMYRLRAALPEDVPKSAATLLRWKTTKPEKYEYIASRAKELNLQMVQELPKFKEPQDPDPSYKGKRK